MTEKELKRNALETITEEEFLAKLKSNRPLKIKLGIDATAPNIHLGFAVVLRKLRQFQEAGHKAILIIGDFTAMIGDPSGRSKTRPQLLKQEVEENVKSYKQQVFKILVPEKTEFVYNSQWLAKLNSRAIIDIASRYTVARILERDDFSLRLDKGIPLHMHEILYPLFQGYDSVAVKADVELGGADQKWNLLVGRELQKGFGQVPQVVMTLPLLEGTDGVRKMSKSFDNYIGITEPPGQIYGKIMSIPDELIIKYFQLCTELSDKKIENYRQRLNKGENPKNLKSELAKEVVSMYHSRAMAEKAEQEFERVFKQKGLPDKIPEFLAGEETIDILSLLVKSGLLPSRSEARRKLGEGAVYINNQRIEDPFLKIEVKEPIIVRVGKRKFLKVKPKE